MISIIIPVYQCEKIISDIIEDILKQTYQDYEVILVDDGSTDSSAQICKEYEKRDFRIRAVFNEHQGVSGTRNAGIAVAKGEYVAFIDSDDRIEPDYLEQLHKNVKGKDLVISTFDRWFYNHADDAKIEKNIQLNAEIDMQDNFAEYFSELYVSTLLGVVYCKLFRTDIIRKNQIKFQTDIYIGEDFLFNFDYLKNCNTIRCIPYMGYHYICKRGDSLTHKNDLKKFEYGKKLFKESVEFAEEMNLSEAETKGIYNLYLRTIFKNIEVMHQMKDQLSIKEKKEYIRKVMTDQNTKDTLEKSKPDTKEFLLYKIVLNTKLPFVIYGFAKVRMYYKKMIGRC